MGCASAGCLALCPAHAQGFWQEASLPDALDKPVALNIGDLDSDGYLDLVIAGQTQQSPGTLSIRWGGPYGFQYPDACQIPFSYPDRVYVEDLNADGRPELVVAHAANTQVTVFVNGGAQASGCPIALTPTVLPPTQGAQMLGFVDLDSDGKLDIVMAGGGGHELTYEPQLPTSPIGGTPQFGAPINISQAAGANAQPPVTSVGFGFAKGLGCGDFDGDGSIDVVVGAGSSIGPGIYVFYNRPAGWEHQILYGGVLGRALGVAVGDFDLDGLTDFAASFVSQGIVTFLNTGPPSGGVYSNVVAVPTTGVGLSAAPLISGDFDGDGLLDLAYGDPASYTLAVAFNPGSGVFDSSHEIHYPLDLSGSRGLAAGDIDADGDLDFVNAIYTNKAIESFFNQVAPNARKPTQAVRLRGGAPSLALADLDAPDGVAMVQSSSSAPFGSGLGGFLWGDRFKFRTQGAQGSRIRIRINDASAGTNVLAHLALRDVVTYKLVWVAQYAEQTSIADTRLDVPNAARFGSLQGAIELVLLHSSAAGSFQSTVDQLSLELIP